MKKIKFLFYFILLPNIIFSNNITILNTKPTAIAQSNIQAFEQTKVSITLTGTDPEDDALTYILHKVPLNGRVMDPNDNNKTIYEGTIITTDKIDYISTSDSADTDVFEFKVFDGKLQSEAAKITISILVLSLIHISEPTRR